MFEKRGGDGMNFDDTGCFEPDNRRRGVTDPEKEHADYPQLCRRGQSFDRTALVGRHSRTTHEADFVTICVKPVSAR